VTKDLQEKGFTVTLQGQNMKISPKLGENVE
jgi:hypothetical protein